MIFDALARRRSSMILKTSSSIYGSSPGGDAFAAAGGLYWQLTTPDQALSQMITRR